METLDLNIDNPRFAPTRRAGPVSAARQRRTWIVYLSLVALGVLPTLMNASPGLKATGLGLWLPGGGFVAVGGWAGLLFPLTLVLFVLAFVAWFWAGVVVAPVIVWLGAALLAGAMAGETTSAAAPWIVGLTAFAIIGTAALVNVRQRSAGEWKTAQRYTFLPQSLAEVAVQSAAAPDPAAREMTPDQFMGLRYLLDRALQPVGGFDGFTIVDQFQPAALRYQINHMGFALAIAQGAYVPNFRGYMGQAQRNLIEKYLEKRVWDYWVLESCWGHLNFTNWDPAAKDNIMLTGWFGAHVGGYMLASGDRRYLEPGSLTFRLNDRTAYVHDFRSIVKSITDNYEKAEFGLFACEPNWIYPICNHYGMLALVTHDALLKTNVVGRHIGNFFAKLDAEFTDSTGSIIGLRSQHTGMPIPFPVPEAGYAFFENTFAPARARKLWAIGREEVQASLRDEPQGLRMTSPGAGIDVGNYKPGVVYDYGVYLISAREFGDERVAQAALRGLEADGEPSREGGTLRYLKASTLANTVAITGQLMGVGDFRRTFAQGPTQTTLAGPMIETMDYPNVLVARAYSDGEGLEAVFYPGAAAGVRAIPLSQLTPGARYAVTGAQEDSVVADADGRATLNVALNGRTAVSLRPAHSRAAAP